MWRLKKEEQVSAKEIDQTDIEKLEHRNFSLEKRILTLETDHATFKVQLEHEIPRDKAAKKKYFEKALQKMNQKSESLATSLKEKLVAVKDSLTSRIDSIDLQQQEFHQNMLKQSTLKADLSQPQTNLNVDKQISDLRTYNESQLTEVCSMVEEIARVVQNLENQLNQSKRAFDKELSLQMKQLNINIDKEVKGLKSRQDYFQNLCNSQIEQASLSISAIQKYQNNESYLEPEIMVTVQQEEDTSFESEQEKKDFDERRLLKQEDLVPQKLNVMNLESSSDNQENISNAFNAQRQQIQDLMK